MAGEEEWERVSSLLFFLAYTYILSLFLYVKSPRARVSVVGCRLPVDQTAVRLLISEIDFTIIRMHGIGRCE